MAAGAHDSNGIWLYGEDDERDTFSELLNIGQDATSDAISADRARLSALEAAGALGAATSGIATNATGFTLNSSLGRRKNGIAFIQLSVTLTGANITVPASGDISNTPIATMNAGWVPAPGLYYQMTPLDNRPVFGGVASTDARITTAAPGTTITTGTLMQFLATYPLA